MIRDLARVLGPEHRRELGVYLVWLAAYGVLQGLAVLSLFGVLSALLAGDVAAGWRAVWLPLVAVLVTCVARYQQAMRGFALSLVTLTTLHHRLGDHVAALPLGWFSAERVGRLSRSATGGTVMVTNVTAHLLTPLATGLLAPATVALGLLVLDVRLGLVLLLAAPLLVASHRWAARVVEATEEDTDAAGALAAARVVEFARQQKVLRAFGRTTDGHRPLDEAIDGQRAAWGRMLRRSAPRLLSNGLGVQLVFVVVLGVALGLLLTGNADPVATVVLLALAVRVTGPLAELAGQSGLLRMAANDLRRLAAVFDEQPLVEPAVGTSPTRPGEIVLEQVRFGYRPDEPVLTDVDLVVRPGTMVAVVGASGSGKTTLTRLVMRFFDVDDGTVRVGGVDVRDQTTADLMSQLSVVMQDVYLFDDTLVANIRIGRPDATDDEVREAAGLAGVDEIVARLPDGWDARVGEGGTSLSGGERQRVSIARALLKDAPIVLLDEATAALDPENERIVGTAIAALRERSTLLVVAHRLPTVTAADRIVVLDGGRIVESGSHAELLAAGAAGRYAAFWESRRRARGWRLTAGD